MIENAESWNSRRERTGGSVNTGRVRIEDTLSKISDITTRRTDWLWSGRIPLGEISCIEGDPSVNKSSLLLDLAARVSTGTTMPTGDAVVHGKVLLLLAEDSIAKTVKRRLEVANADLNQIAVPNTEILLPRDLEWLEQVVLGTSPKLIIIDPLMAFLGVNANNDRAVRQVLTPLQKLAESANCAIVLVRHLVKSSGKDVMYQGGGSIGIVAATRSTLLVGKSPEEPELRVVAQVKSNLGPLSQSVLFESVDDDGVPKIEWRGECSYTAQDLLKKQGQRESRLREAIAFLSERLAEGAVEQQEIKRQAIAAGLAYRTVERAKEMLGIISDRSGFGPGSRCYWSLPSADD